MRGARELRMGWLVCSTLVASWFFAAACGTESPTDATLPPISLLIVSGDGQQEIVGRELPNPLVVQVLDEKSRPVKGQLVNFRVVTGGGSVYAGSSLTNADGKAQDYWTMGAEPGPGTLEVRAVNPTTGEKQNFATFTATALPETFTLIVSLDGSGTVTGLGIDCPSTCSADHTSGTEITLTASASAGFVFSGWTGDCTGATCSLTMDGPRSVQAVFAEAGPCGGGQYLEHSSGLGPSYLHCNPLGQPGTPSTYDVSMATAAAEAWDPTATRFAVTCGSALGVGASGPAGIAVWVYSSNLAGYVRLEPGETAQCPVLTSLTWN